MQRKGNIMEIQKDLSKGWQILQDVHDLGEKMRLYMPERSDTSRRMIFSEWEQEIIIKNIYKRNQVQTKIDA